MPEQSDPVTITQKRYRCRHIHAAGHQCGSPALRNEQFCYHHHTTRPRKPGPNKYRHFDAFEPFQLPVVEDLASALSVASQLLCRLASNDLDAERAGKMLYNLQLITTIIDRASRAAAIAGPIVKPEPVAELVNDETHGPIAPITELPLAAIQPPIPGAPCQTKSDVGIPSVILSEARSAQSKDPETLHATPEARAIPGPPEPVTTPPLKQYLVPPYTFYVSDDVIPRKAPERAAGESNGAQKDPDPLHATPAASTVQPPPLPKPKATPPPPERIYTREEQDYFKHTVMSKGYEPRKGFLRPASITDDDIQARTAANRRYFGLPPLTPRTDEAGRLISFHELHARFTIPAPKPTSDGPQPATLPTLQAAAERRPRRKTPTLLRIRRRKTRALQPFA